jgi:hypothetical protein
MRQPEFRLGTGLSIAAIVLGLSGVEPEVWAAAPETPRFRDTQQHWAGACIDRLATLKQLSGYPDGSFRPDAKLSRSEFAALILDRFPWIPDRNIFRRSSEAEWIAPPETLFKDVPRQHWAYGAINAAYEAGIFVGYPDQTFRPNQAIARVEALAILAKIVPTGQRPRSNEQPLPIPEIPERVLRDLLDDAAQTPPWSQSAIATAASFFLVVDAPNGRRLRPTDATTRAEAAAFLCQAQRLDGLIPPEAVAGNQYFTQSPELKKLQRATTEGKKVWFDFQREITISPTAPPGFTIAYLGESPRKGSDRILAWFNRVDAPADSSPLAGYFDADGKIAIPPQFTSAGLFSEGLADVQIAGKKGFIDRAGTLVISIEFDETRSFREGLAAIRIDQQWGFIDKTGAWAVPLQPYRVESFSDGLARIEVKGVERWSERYGFIDRTGKTVIEPKFNLATSFTGGLSAVSLYQTETGQFDPRSGYIDKTGQWVPTPQAKEDSQFMDGIAIVQVDKKFGLTDRQGKFVVPPKYAAISNIENGYFYVNYGGVEVGYITEYDGSATPTGGGSELRGGRWGYLKLPTSNQNK